MNFNLRNNKNLILTSGAGLLSSEFSIFLVKQGYNVFIFDKNINKFLLLKEKLKVKNTFIFKVDITKYYALRKLYKKILTKCGDIKVLINNASFDWIPKKNKKIKIELNSKNIINEFNKLLLFLISKDSSCITGQNIIADGGRSII